MKAKVEQFSENVDAVDFEQDVNDFEKLEYDLSIEGRDYLLTLLFEAYMLGYNRACERNGDTNEEADLVGPEPTDTRL